MLRERERAEWKEKSTLFNGLAIKVVLKHEQRGKKRTKNLELKMLINW